VTQESGFVASAAALAGGAAYSIATGLLLAEVYINARGAGSVSGGDEGSASASASAGDSGGDEGSGTAAFASIVRSTLGEGGLAVGAGAYVFLHLALLVAYISKSSEILDAATGAGPLPSALLFTGAFGGLCYFASAPLLDRVNGGLVALILAAFFGLLASAAPGVDGAALLRADWGAVPGTLPVIALSFVYHNGGRALLGGGTGS
jgi:tyrosine-specific transport protein